MDPKVFLQSKFVTILLSCMLVFVMIITARLLLQKREIDSEIHDLQTKADEIQKNNRQLSELIKYLNSSEYAEKEAREKLNLRKDGEYVVVLPKENQGDGKIAGIESENNNPQLWFDYFFGAK